ncbi:hypothetical protein [Crocosphaera chwakensis]|uniref:Uncharacterized protein n=1 Tax=Crocosphaera chwakensis CCY0110 TaxID=391612 RepID=A3IWS3_9CHRO|nr:hypothetical protein [Crocosphaera chwakensis]EAZ89078.1 hypothetical protein CY0110_08706 [Crocosphaera chwakensis CCY0110]
MKKQTQVYHFLNSLSINLLGKFKYHYPWLIIAAIAYLFLFPFSGLVAVTPTPQNRVKTIVRETKINYTKYPKILVFMGDKNNRGKGKLIAVNAKEGKIDGAWNALSGVGGEENQPMRGPIPSQTRVNVTRYIVIVDVRPLTLSNPGIAGKFYKINPHLVSVGGVTRGDFGIHADRNVPGTAGCIGIESESEWISFKVLMSDYGQAGLKTIPLLVSYR